MIKKIGMTCLTVSDFGKARRFFVDTLGLRAEVDSEHMPWMELSAGDEPPMLGVGGYDPAYAGMQKPGTNGIVSFLVDDLAKGKAELEAKGIQFLGKDMEVEGHVKLAKFADEDGNQFLLVQDLSGQK